MVDQGTRINSGSAPTLLDLVLTDRPELVRDVLVLPPIGKGGHCFVIVSMLTKWKRAKKKKTNRTRKIAVQQSKLGRTKR